MVCGHQVYLKVNILYIRCVSTLFNKLYFHIYQISSKNKCLSKHIMAYLPLIIVVVYFFYYLFVLFHEFDITLVEFGSREDSF